MIPAYLDKNDNRMIKHLGKATILSVLIVISCNVTYAQNEIDSLRRVLVSLEGEEKVDALNSLASYLSYTEPLEADSLLEISQKLISKISYGEGQVKKWLVQATLSNFRSQFDQSDSLLSLAVRSAEQSGDSTGMANAYMTLGTTSARRGNLAESIEYHIKSLKAARAITNFELECANLLNIGVINLRLGNLEKAKDFFSRGADVARRHNLKYRLAQSYLNLGLIMYNLGDLNESIEYIQGALKAFGEMDDKRGMGVALRNLAYAQNLQSDHQKALESYQQALNIYKELEDPVEIIKTQIPISKVYVSMGRLAEALDLIEEVLWVAPELDDLSLERDAYRIRLDIYEKMGEYKLALETLKSLNVSEDSIERRADKARIDALVTEFESELKDTQLQLKNQRIELLESESEVSKTRQYLLALIVVLLLLSVFSLRYIYITRLKRSYLNEKIAREEGENAARKNTKLTGELKQKSVELQKYASLLADHQEELAGLKSALTQSDKEADITYLNEVSRSLNRKDVELLNWQDFRLRFDEVHSGFVAILNTAHPALTPREIDLCVLLKVSVPNNEISQILEITYDGVKKAVRRTYKKMSLSSAEELRNYILQLN